MNIDFKKYKDGLVPAIVQDADTEKVLMLGFMNAEALELTKQTGRATFYSRSRKSLWAKGETSSNVLAVHSIIADCDSDTLLIKASPAGPVCHTGNDTCFNEKNDHRDFLFTLEDKLRDRKREPVSGSYTSKLFSEGINRIAQKVGEEAVELVIEAKDCNNEAFRNEAADLMYHLLVLLVQKGINLSDVIEVLRSRATDKTSDAE